MHLKKLTEIFHVISRIILCLSAPFPGIHSNRRNSVRTVSDSSGAAISGAQISIRNGVTGIVTDVMGNADGYYGSELGPRDLHVRVTPMALARSFRPLPWR